MNSNRRNFISSALVSGVAAATLPLKSFGNSSTKNLGSAELNRRYEKLDKVLEQPIFKKEFFPNPVIIKSVELLKFGPSFLCRVRSNDGAEGISAAHGDMNVLYPIFVNNLQPFFIGQDARRLDALMEKAYIFKLNYRCKGYALGIPAATIEFAILDMMGRIANKPVGELIGKIHNTHIPVYQATEFRERPVQESLELIKNAVYESKAEAVKIKVGALMFMTKELDAVGQAKRTEEIIPLIRKTFGDKMALYADANGFYDVKNAIRVGKLLAENKYSYFEEPVQYDWLERTKEVKDAVSIPIAGGEQQHGIEEFRWLIANDGLDIVQPDQYYFGGLLRSMKVARMAESRGKICTPHLSGGFGYIYMMHFISAIPNPGPHIEFKGYAKIPIECKTSPLKLENGKIKVPTGPGIGVDIDPDFIKKHTVVKDV
jgi:L-alanine-DL-glutamate epimerase-like enolase superfamily enzyme